MKRTSVRWLSALLCAVLLLSAGPMSALAAEEAPAPEDPIPEETVAADTFEEGPAEESPAEPEVPEEPLDEAEPGEDSGEELPAEAPAEEAPVSEEPGEEPEEEAEEAEALSREATAEAAEALETEEAVPEEVPAAEDVFSLADPAIEGDPDDPLYARYALGVDGAGTKTWADFTTRKLKSNETLRKGIDVSSWQGTINWTKVKKAGVQFVILRCAYRGVSSGKIVEDSHFYDYIKGAQAAGLKVGVYIFSQAITKKEAQEEADFLLKMIKGYKIDLPLVFDLEHYNGGRFTNAGLSKRTTTDIFKAFCARIEKAGYESMVYSNPSTLNANLYPDELGRLWLAHYTTKTSYTARDYEYWQCSSDGSVNGISTPVDLDFWFQPEEDEGNPFTDVKKTDWFHDTVLQAYKKGVVTGVTDKLFDPGGTATRAQVVTMIHRTQKTPKAEKASAFTDLTQDWYKAAVDWAVEKGVVTGYSETDFKPDRAITREELVTILYRMKGSPEVTGDLSAFTDGDKVQAWARDAMVWAVANKIVTGYEDDTLRPKSVATRAEVCTILMRYTALK